jgi:hypothetical protein
MPWSVRARTVLLGPGPVRHSKRAAVMNCQESMARESLGRRPIRAGRYGAAILLHCASAVCLSEAIGIFAAAVRQVCLALLSAALTFALLVVI